MIKTKILITVLILSIQQAVFAQKEPELMIQLLDVDMVADACMKRDALLDWVSTFTYELTEQLGKVEGDYDLKILVGLHHNQDVTVEFSSKPGLPVEIESMIQDSLAPLKSTRANNGHYSFFVFAKLNNGCADKKMDYAPEVLSPYERRMDEFKTLSMLDKKLTIQKWVAEDVIPVIAFHTTKAEKQFEGVRNVGKMLSKNAISATSVNELTSDNFDYWRATLEMAQWNQIIPFSRACLHATRGEFGIAERYVFLCDLFSDDATLVKVYSPELTKKINLFTKDLDKEVNKGIALHDEKKFDEAILIYETLLKDFPESAWIQYEYFYSKSAKASLDSTSYYWDQHKELIYDSDPMYGYCASASNGVEGYEIYLRQTSLTLFESRDKIKEDLLTLGDIAFDLQNYDYAAQIYWMLFSHLEKKDYQNRNLIAYFLYCMEKLGHTSLKTNFKGDFEKEFVKIEKERQKIMEKNFWYQMFEGK